MPSRIDRRGRRRALARVEKRLRAVLDVGRRRRLADARFFQLLTRADHDSDFENQTGHDRLARLANPL